MSGFVMPTIDFVMTEEEAAAILLQISQTRGEEVDRMDTADSPTFPFAHPAPPAEPPVYRESEAILRWLDAVPEEVNGVDHPHNSQSSEAAQDDDDDVSILDISTDTIAEAMAWDRITNPSESNSPLSGTTLVPSTISYVPETSLTDLTDTQTGDERQGESGSICPMSAISTNEEAAARLLAAIEDVESMDED